MNNNEDENKRFQRPIAFKINAGGGLTPEQEQSLLEKMEKLSLGKSYSINDIGSYNGSLYKVVNAITSLSASDFSNGNIIEYIPNSLLNQAFTGGFAIIKFDKNAGYVVRQAKNWIDGVDNASQFFAEKVIGSFQATAVDWVVFKVYKTGFYDLCFNTEVKVLSGTPELAVVKLSKDKNPATAVKNDFEILISAWDSISNNLSEINMYHPCVYLEAGDRVGVSCATFQASFEIIHNDNLGGYNTGVMGDYGINAFNFRYFLRQPEITSGLPSPPPAPDTYVTIADFEDYVDMRAAGILLLGFSTDTLINPPATTEIPASSVPDNLLLSDGSYLVKTNANPPTSRLWEIGYAVKFWDSSSLNNFYLVYKGNDIWHKIIQLDKTNLDNVLIPDTSSIPTDFIPPSPKQNNAWEIVIRIANKVSINEADIVDLMTYLVNNFYTKAQVDALIPSIFYTQITNKIINDSNFNYSLDSGKNYVVSPKILASGNESFNIASGKCQVVTIDGWLNCFDISGISLGSSIDFMLNLRGSQYASQIQVGLLFVNNNFTLAQNGSSRLAEPDFINGVGISKIIWGDSFIFNNNTDEQRRFFKSKKTTGDTKIIPIIRSFGGNIGINFISFEIMVLNASADLTPTSQTYPTV